MILGIPLKETIGGFIRVIPSFPTYRTCKFSLGTLPIAPASVLSKTKTEAECPSPQAARAKEEETTGVRPRYLTFPDPNVAMGQNPVPAVNINQSNH